MLQIKEHDIIFFQAWHVSKHHLFLTFDPHIICSLNLPLKLQTSFLEKRLLYAYAYLKYIATI